MAEIKARIRALLRLDQTTALNNPNYRNVPAKHPPSVQTAFRANRSSSCGLLVTNNNALRTDSVLMLSRAKYSPRVGDACLRIS